jgi:hypothetical protein
MTAILKLAHNQQISGALDSNGDFFPLDSCKQTIFKDGSGAISYITAEFGGVTWKQSFTKAADGAGTKQIISMWEKQV